MPLPTAPARAATKVEVSATPLRVTLYTRELCCCCQTAREALAEYQRDGAIAVEEVDASDPMLEALIGPTVPVIAVDGKVRFRGEVNRVLLDRLLDARAGRA